MDKNTIKISIPLDKDGYIELECDYCKYRFMLPEITFTSEDTISLFCPICGLPNYINTFYTPEVLEVAQQLAVNYALEEIERSLGKSLRKFNKNSLFKMTMKSPKKEHIKELYQPISDYTVVSYNCCKTKAKVTSFDNEVGVYCPICGGEKT